MVITPDTKFPKKFGPTAREARDPYWAQALTCSTSTFWKFGQGPGVICRFGWLSACGLIGSSWCRVDFNHGVSHHSSLRLSGWSLLNLVFCIFLMIILRIITAQQKYNTKNSGGLNFRKHTPLIIDHQIWNHGLRWSIFYAGLQILLFTLPVTLPRPTQLYIFKSPVPDRYLHMTKPAELTKPTELVCYALWTIVRVTLPSPYLIDNLAKPLCLLNCLWLDIYFFWNFVS